MLSDIEQTVIDNAATASGHNDNEDELADQRGTSNPPADEAA
jgi:hypothetical protein